MKIDLQTLLKIGKAHPDLTVLEYAGSMAETTKELKRDADRQRMQTKRKASDTERHGATTGDNERQPATYAEQERELYRFAEQVCGKRVGSFTTTLLRANRNDIAAARAIFERAQQANDPRAFIATAAGKVNNGAGHSDVSAAGERVIAAREERERTLDLEDYHDITERRG